MTPQFGDHLDDDTDYYRCDWETGEDRRFNRIENAIEALQEELAALRIEIALDKIPKDRYPTIEQVRGYLRDHGLELWPEVSGPGPCRERYTKNDSSFKCVTFDWTDGAIAGVRGLAVEMASKPDEERSPAAIIAAMRVWVDAKDAAP